MCTASSRLLVPADRRAEALALAAEVARGSAPADPFMADSTHGAIVSEQQLERVAGLVARAGAEGARVVAGSSERRSAGRKGVGVAKRVQVSVMRGGLLINKKKKRKTK